MFWIIVIIIALVLFDHSRKKRSNSKQSFKQSSDTLLIDRERTANKVKHAARQPSSKASLTELKKKNASRSSTAVDEWPSLEDEDEDLKELIEFQNNEDQLNSSPLAAALHRRGITRLLHFTKAENLKSIEAHGILSVASMRHRRVVHVHNDDVRLDAKLNGISLSITHPNSLMFYKYRQKSSGAWAVIELSSSAMYDLECEFFYTNAASKTMRSLKSEELTGIKAFERMFEGSLNPAYPTDVQAEILCFNDIPIQYIAAVYVENSWYHRQVEKLQLPFPVKVDRTLFEQRSH